MAIYGSLTLTTHNYSRALCSTSRVTLIYSTWFSTLGPGPCRLIRSPFPPPTIANTYTIPHILIHTLYKYISHTYPTPKHSPGMRQLTPSAYDVSLCLHCHILSPSASPTSDTIWHPIHIPQRPCIKMGRLRATGRQPLPHCTR